MGKWQILSIILIQNLVGGNLIVQNDDLLDVGEHDFLKNAVKVLQIEAIADLTQTIKDLSKENKEKERQIEQIKKEKTDEITKLKEEFERKLEQQSKEKSILAEKLKGQTTLANYLMIVITKSQQVYKTKNDLIEHHAKDMNELQTKLGECKQNNINNLKIVFNSQQTIFKQKEGMGRLEKLMVLEKNLTKSKQDNLKSECNTASWIESLTKAYNEQEEKIDELTLFIKDKDKMEDHMNKIQVSLSKINQTDTVEECSPKYQQLVISQSESISLLGTLASYAIISTSSLQYEEDENGNLISAKKCNCLPEPLNTGLKPVSIKYECGNKTNPNFHLNCGDGLCSNKYWPKCVQDIEEMDAKDDSAESDARDETKENVFEWSSWSVVENIAVKKRESRKVPNIYQEADKGEDKDKGILLYTHDGYGYYKVPAADGTKMVEGSVAETCKRNKMKAVCYRPGSEHNSAECKVSSLGSESLIAISKLICNGQYATECPKTEGIFVSMKNWHGSECGNIKGTYCAEGKNFVSGPNNPYFAFCIR